MFKWWKKRQEIKKMKALQEALKHTTEVLGTLRERSILPNTTDDYDITKLILDLYKIMDKLHEEIDDRARERVPFFQKEDEFEDK